MLWWSVTALAVVVAFVLGGVSAHLWVRRHHWHPDYGDVPTWATAAITLAAAVFALGQLRLLGVSQRQANQVIVRTQAGALTIVSHPDEQNLVRLMNTSQRPIRNVRALLGEWSRVYNHRVEKRSGPSEVGIGLPGSMKYVRLPITLAVLPPGQWADFVTSATPSRDPGPFHNR